MSHPETTNWLDVHNRFVQGDRAAWEVVVKHFLEWLSQSFFRRQPNMDRHLIVESVEDALLDYQKRPQRFDATLGVPLGYWLYIQTRGRLSDLLRQARNHQRHEQTIGIEDENVEKIAKILSRKRPRSDYLLTEEQGETTYSEEERQVLTRFSPEEQEALVLLQERVPNEEWIRLLGLEGLPPAEQERQMNKEKERIRKKRQRVLRQSLTYGHRVPVTP